MVAAKTRKFGGKVYHFAGEFHTKWAADSTKDRISYDAFRNNAAVDFRLLKVVSHAPPQGGVFYRLYYRRYGDEEYVRRHMRGRKR